MLVWFRTGVLFALSEALWDLVDPFIPNLEPIVFVIERLKHSSKEFLVLNWRELLDVATLFIFLCALCVFVNIFTSPYEVHARLYFVFACILLVCAVGLLIYRLYDWLEEYR